MTFPLDDSKRRSTVRIAIVEDIANIRASLEKLLAAIAGFELVASVVTGEEAVEILPKSRADVVLMDIKLPGMSGVECVRMLKEVMPETEFMMLTMFEDQEQVFASLRAGASGYLVKGLSPEKLMEAVKELSEGGSPMSSSIARRVVKCFREPLPMGGVENLSLREEDVLKRLAAGQRYKEIAADLSLSAHTVRTHLRRIYRKLHVRTKVEAARAYRRGQSA